MAEFALGLTKSAVEGTLSRVRSAIDEEAKLKVRVQNDLIFITGEFQMMQSFLSVANKERAKNEVVRTWVRQIRELAFDVEDCVELVVGLDIKSGWSWLWRVLPGCVAPSRPLDDAVAEIERLKARVEDVSHRNARYNLIGDSGTDSKPINRETTVSKSDSMHNSNPPSSAFHTLREVWEAAGKMRQDVDDLKKLITEQGSGLEVISLWGSPGSVVDLGTTSIVRKTYNDPEICQDFKIRAWVKLMHPFNLDEFLKSLLTQFYASSQKAKVLGAEFRGKMISSTGRGDHLMKAQLIQQVSQEQRYLVMVEQLSSMEEWDTIRMYLPDSANGSRIVVAVQQLGLALSCTGKPYHVAELQQFSDRHSLCAFFDKEWLCVSSVPTGISPVRFGAFASPEETDVDESDEETTLMERLGLCSHFEKNDEETPSTSQVVDNIDKKVKEQLAMFLSSKAVLVPGQDPESRDEQRSHLLSRHFSSRMVEACNWITKSGLIGHYDEWSNLCHKLHKGVFSVWGIAGVGKSTLVRSIYYNSLIGISQYHAGTRRPIFGILSDVTHHSWVDVSYPFSLTDFSRRLLLDFHSDDLDAKETEAVGMIEGQDPIMRCRKFMCRDDYFVVIDGLRSMNDWDFIKDALLPEPIEGCIIVITNEKNVATHCADKEDRVINTKGLEANAALNLFTKIAWDSKQLTSEAEDLARRTMNNCGGLPKVIAAIGDYHRCNARGSFKYLKIINSDFMGMLESDPSLRGLFSWMQSYFDACPDSLKPCIFYMSVFRFGHDVRRRRLLRRWIAEGYSRDTSSSTAEENGETFFSELVKLSIIQQEQSPSKVDVCQLNGFFREYIISRPMQDNLVFALDGHVSLNSQRSGQHLTISSNWDRAKILMENMELSRLRSFTVFGQWSSFFISANVKMKLLRVLDLEDTLGVKDDNIEKIGELLPRLKYLSLRGCSDITRLPSSLGGMRQLQTLDIKGTSIVTLPPAIMKLEKLQYLRAGRRISTSSEHNNGTVVGVGTRPPADANGVSTSQEQAAAADIDGASTSQAPLAAAVAEDDHSRTSTPWRSRPHSGLVFDWLSKSCGNGLVSSDHDGVQFPAWATRGIRKLRALHTLGVLNVEGASGNAVLRELKKLAQLRRLKLLGVNRKNWKHFCDAISGHCYLESLSVRLDEEEDKETGAAIAFGRFSEISEPPKTLKTLKVYGRKSAHISPVWMKQLHNLTNTDLELTVSTQLEIDALAELPYHCKLPRVCVKPTQDGDLKFYWGDRGLDISLVIASLEIYCGSYKLTLLFEDRVVEPDCDLQQIRVWKVSSIQLCVTELVVHYSSTEASLELYGLGNVPAINKVWLKGSYSEAQEQNLRQQLGRKLELCTQR